MIFTFVIHIEFCSALSNYVHNVVSSNYVRQMGWRLARKKITSSPWTSRLSRAFCNLFLIIISVCAVRFRSNMAHESITFELGRHVSDIICLIEQNTCQSYVIEFRLDWLYNAVVRYCDNIPSGEAVIALIQEATELLRQSGDN